MFASPIGNTVIMAYKGEPLHSGYDSHISFDGGDTWQPIFADKLMQAALFAPNGNIYLATQKYSAPYYLPDTLFRSSDGINWTNLGIYPGGTLQDEGDFFVTGNNTLLFPAVLNGVHLRKSIDDGVSWTPTSNIGVTQGKVESVCASHTSETIIVGTYNSGVRYSHDGGATFASATGGGWGAGTVGGAAILPNGDVYVVAGGISKSTDGGITFSPITYNPWVAMTIIEFFYHSPSGKFFTRALQGIFESTDCITWTNITGNLTDVNIVKDMATSQNYLYVAKYGDDNLYRYEIQGVTGISEAGEENDFLVYPNPANEFITIGNIPVGSSVNVFDVTGKVVYNVTVKLENTRINTGSFTNGIYTLQIESNGGVATKKLVVGR